MVARGVLAGIQEEVYWKARRLAQVAELEVPRGWRAALLLGFVAVAVLVARALVAYLLEWEAAGGSWAWERQQAVAGQALPGLLQPWREAAGI